MASRREARARARRARRRRIRALGVLVVVAAIVVALGWRLPSSSSSSAAGPMQVGPEATTPAVGEARRDGGEALGEAGGAVPRGATVFDDRLPAVANLDPAILQALRRAAADAAATGCTVNWIPLPARSSCSATGCENDCELSMLISRLLPLCTKRILARRRLSSGIGGCWAAAAASRCCWA